MQARYNRDGVRRCVIGYGLCSIFLFQERKKMAARSWTVAKCLMLWQRLPSFSGVNPTPSSPSSFFTFLTWVNAVEFLRPTDTIWSNQHGPRDQMPHNGRCDWSWQRWGLTLAAGSLSRDRSDFQAFRRLWTNIWLHYTCQNTRLLVLHLPLLLVVTATSLVLLLLLAVWEHDYFVVLVQFFF